VAARGGPYSDEIGDPSVLFETLQKFCGFEPPASIRPLSAIASRIDLLEDQASSGLPRTFGPKAASVTITMIIAMVIRPNTPPTPPSRSI